MRFNGGFFRKYLNLAPFSLAFERSLECEIFSHQVFEPPVLDVGCGDGLFASVLFDEKIDLGIDPDERELMRAKQLGGYVELLPCCGDRIPRADRSFTTVFSNSVLEHIPNLEAVLREVHRLLSDDGRFYVTLPTDLFSRYTVVSTAMESLGLKSAAARCRKLYDSFWGHYHCYSVSRWSKIFQECGFTVVKSIQYGSRGACLLDDLMVPLAVPSWLTKKVANRWTLLPQGRPLLTFPLILSVNDEKVRRSTNIANGGLVFFHLRKRGTTT
jgi:SAM-dependent methyltransferase